MLIACQFFKISGAFQDFRPPVAAPWKLWNNHYRHLLAPPRNFGETPRNFDYPEFFDIENKKPDEMRDLIHYLKKLSVRQLDSVSFIVEELANKYGCKYIDTIPALTSERPVLRTFELLKAYLRTHPLNFADAMEAGNNVFFDNNNSMTNPTLAGSHALS